MNTVSPTGPDRVIRLERFFSYPKQVIYLLVSALALVSLVHYLSLAQKYIRARRSTRPRSKAGWYILVPYALIDSLRAVLFRWSVPVPFGYSLNIAEVGLTVGYLAVLLTWTFVNTTTVTGVKVEPHYWANRAGTIAASQLPLVTALGMRNNLVSYLTGISYDKLNYLHRIGFRSLVIIIWIHASGRVTVGLLDDEALTSRWVQCGLLAAITLVVMTILTLRPLRKLSYEVFLVIHFVFALIFLLSVYFHLTGRDLTYYGAWPAMIVWGTDRFIRLVKLPLFNLPSLLSRSRAPITQNTTVSNSTTRADAINSTPRLGFGNGYNARIEILPGATTTPANPKTSAPASMSSTQNQNQTETETDSDAESFLKLTIHIPALASLSLSSPLTALINPLYTWRPGQSVYLSVPSLALRGWWPFEAHPFTIANVCGAGMTPYNNHLGVLGGEDEEKAQTRGTTTNTDSNTDTNADSGDIYLTFFIRVRHGFTKRLFEAVHSSSHETTHSSTLDTTPTLYTNVVLNGPYSAPPVLVGYERVVLIAGGSGVAFTLPLLLDLIAKSHTPQKSGCKRVLFIWAIRDASQISWIASFLRPSLAALSQSSSPASLELDIRFYITSTSSIPSSTGSATPPSTRSAGSVGELSDIPRTPSPEFKFEGDVVGVDEVDADVLASFANDNLDLESFSSDMVNVSTNKGRPDIARLVKGEVNADEGEGAGAGGVVSVNVCGPASLITATRAALRVPRPLDIMNGAPRVVLHVEAFGGA